MSIRFALGVAICCALVAAAAFGEPTESLSQTWFSNAHDRLGSRSHRGPGAGSKGGERKAPAWARDARWYQVDVARFRNGDPSNDPEGTLPWSAVWPPADGSAENLDNRQYGGDLKGLESKLPYLKQFGINALCLSPIFTDDLRHVDDSFGAKGGSSAVVDETVDPTKLKFSPGDRVFLGFLKEAHRQGFRVVVDAESMGDAERLLKMTRRWMDPDGDGNPSDGVDGWMLRTSKNSDAVLGKRLREQVKKINSKAILVAYVQDAASKEVGGDWFDAAISYEAGDAIRRFFSGRDKTYTLDKFFGDLSAGRERHGLDTCVTMLSAVSGPDAGRLLYGLMAAGVTREETRDKVGARKDSRTSQTERERQIKPTEKTCDRWRLATLFQHFYLGAPVTYYGDEVGMYGPAGTAARAPMWWDDLPSPGAKPAEYRRDFLALVRFLSIRRELHAPLRHGDFRRVLLDEKRKILAFARTLRPRPAGKPVPQGGNEVILVVNYGAEKQKVKIRAGRPGQIIGLLAPQLKPATGAESLTMGASRQQSDQSGEVTVWVKPMSVHIVLVDEKEGRR